MLEQLLSIRSYWHHRNARWIAPAFLAGFALLRATDWGAATPSTSAAVTAIALGFVTWLVWAIWHRTPQVPRDTIGFVVGIVADSPAQEQQLRADFVRHLRELLAADRAVTHFHLLELPSWLAAQCEDYDTAQRILVRARGSIIIFGAAKLRTIDSAESHMLELRGVVRHGPISEAARSTLSVDFGAAMPKRVTFGINNDAFSFALTSEWIEVGARYVVALAALLSGYLRDAEKLFLSVEERLRMRPVTSPSLQDIARKVPGRMIELYSAWCDALTVIYRTKRDPAVLVEADRVTTELLNRDPDCYRALLSKAMAQFVLRRDVVGAKQTLDRARHVKDTTWRYSYAFLLAYEGRMREARELYDQAFSGGVSDPTVPIQVEEFMHEVLTQEPDKVQLLFCSGLVNMRGKRDWVGAVRDFTEFLDSAASAAFPDEQDQARQLLAAAKRRMLDAGVEALPVA